jgi:hypothetical protein
MPMVRCPSCGRISDGTICLACGNDLLPVNAKKETTQVTGRTESGLDPVTASGLMLSGAQNFEGLSDLTQDSQGVELSDFDEDEDEESSAAQSHQVEEVWGDELTNETSSKSLMESRDHSLEVSDSESDDDMEADAETVTDFNIDDLPSELESENTMVEGESGTNHSKEGPSRQIRLSARVGILAENMETTGRIADASTLYEAEEILQKLGH